MRLLWLKILKRYYEWLMVEPFDGKVSLKLDKVIKELEENNGRNQDGR
jgi:hypothetical protein